MISWPLFRGRRAILTVQLGIGLGFGTHYALLGSMTAALANLLGTLQLVVAMVAICSPLGRLASHTLIVLMLTLPLATWMGPSSAIAAAGTILIAVGRTRSNECVLRRFILMGTATWLVHDVMTGSIIAYSDALSLLIGIYSYRRHIVSSKTPSPVRKTKNSILAAE